MFIKLHDYDTHIPMYVNTDSVQKIFNGPENCGALVFVSGGCASWVQETPASVIGLIMQEEERKSLEERECV